MHEMGEEGAAVSRRKFIPDTDISILSVVDALPGRCSKRKDMKM